MRTVIGTAGNFANVTQIAAKNKLGRMIEKLEHLKASVRAKVERPFHVIKTVFSVKKYL